MVTPMKAPGSTRRDKSPTRSTEPPKRTEWIANELHERVSKQGRLRKPPACLESTNLDWGSLGGHLYQGNKLTAPCHGCC